MTIEIITYLPAYTHSGEGAILVNRLRLKRRDGAKNNTKIDGKCMLWSGTSQHAGVMEGSVPPLTKGTN